GARSGLPSAPTRRSSDLQGNAVALGQFSRRPAASRRKPCALTGDRVKQPFGPREGIAGTTHGKGLGRKGDDQFAMMRRQRRRAEDRKSTRLNSSHVKLSS